MIKSTLQVVVNIRDGVFKAQSHLSEHRRPQEMVAIMMNYNHKHVFSLVTCKNEVNHDNKFYFQITKVEYD